MLVSKAIVPQWTLVYVCLFQLDSQWEYVVWRRDLKPSVLWYFGGKGWGERWEGGSRGRGYMYTYVWLLCNIVLYSIRLYFHHQPHPQLVIVMLWLCVFILSGVISQLFSSSILGTYWPGEFISQFPIFLPFYIVHRVFKARILKPLRFPSPVDHILLELSTMTYPSWVAPHVWLIVSLS